MKPLPPSPAAPAPAPAVSRGVPVWLLAVSLLALVAAVGTLAVVLTTGDETGDAGADEAASATSAETAADDDGGGEADAAVPAAPTTSPGPTTPAAPPPSSRLTPLSVTASSFSPGSNDFCNNPVSYEPAKATDGQPTTAWQVTGDGTGQRITFTFPAGTTVTRVGLVAGYDKVDPCDGTDRFTQNHRIRSVQWQLAPGVRATQTLDTNLRSVQYLDVGPLTTRSVTMQITGIQFGDSSGDTPISEISVLGYP